MGELLAVALDQLLMERVKPELAGIDAILYSLLGRTYAPGPWTEENFALGVPGKWDLSCVCYHDRKLVGFWIIGIIMPGMGFVYRVGFHPAVQRQGFGRTSFAWVWSRIQDKQLCYGLDRLALEVSAENRPAIQFYRSLGFSVLTGSALGRYLEMAPKRRVPILTVETDSFVTGDGHKELTMSVPLPNRHLE